MAIEKPNYTQIPNVVLDDLMALMEETELRVTLAISRRTFGFHRESAKLSLSELQKMTGLSRQGVINGVTAGIKRGTIEREPIGDSYAYRMVVYSVDQEDSQLSSIGGQMDGLPSQLSGLEVVHSVDSDTPVLKKVVKERTTKERKRATAAPCAAPKLQPESLLVFREIFHRNPTAHQGQVIADCVSDLVLWRRVCHEWSMMGYKPTNVEGMLDWYRNGGRTSTPFNRGNGVAPPKQSKVAASMAAVDRVEAMMREQGLLA
jgi:hypothetical protein